jgi:cell division protein FtsL
MINQNNGDFEASDKNSSMKITQKDSLVLSKKVSEIFFSIRKSFLIKIFAIIFIILSIIAIYLILNKKILFTPDSLTEINSNNIKSEQTISDKMRQGISQCEIAHQNDYDKDYVTGNCISDIALKYENYSVCEEQRKYRVPTAADGFISGCIGDIAVSKNDISICATLKDDASEGYRNSCFTGIAKNKKDVSICDLITPDNQLKTVKQKSY